VVSIPPPFIIKMKKEQITSTRTVYSDKCPVCKQEIKGFSESNLQYNMRLHKEKHDKGVNAIQDGKEKRK